MTVAGVAGVGVVEASGGTYPRSRRLWNPAERLARDACETALLATQVAMVPKPSPRRWAVAAVTSSAGEEEFDRQFQGLLAGGWQALRPSTIPQAGLNSVAAMLSIDLAAIGPNITLSGPSYSFGYGVAWAARNLADGHATLALLVAIEEGGTPAVAFGLLPSTASGSTLSTLGWDPVRPWTLTLTRPSGATVLLDQAAAPNGAAAALDAAVALSEANPSREGDDDKARPID